jgi:predicted nucleic acid-binding Zn ribbon protein
VLQTISDKLFMGSLILLMISMVISGIGFQFVSFRRQAGEDPGEQLGSAERKQSMLEKQDRSLRRFYRSYLFWISIIGIVVSILLSYL